LLPALPRAVVSRCVQARRHCGRTNTRRSWTGAQICIASSPHTLEAAAREPAGSFGSSRRFRRPLISNRIVFSQDPQSKSIGARHAKRKSFLSRLASNAGVTLALAVVGCPSVAFADVVLREVDGGPKYYSRFSNPLSSDPNFFPLGVWF